MSPDKSTIQPLTWWRAALFALIAVACFHAAYTPAKSGPLAFGIVGYVICLVQLARLQTTRQCFYVGLAVGFACFAPQLAFFWKLFGPAAVTLWLILALWIAFFLVLSHLALVRLGTKWGALLVTFLWTGLEYFRCELYYLRFSWLNVGYVFAESLLTALPFFGMYGIGFIASLFCGFLYVPGRWRTWLVGGLSLFILYSLYAQFVWVVANTKDPRPHVVTAGVQLEHPDEDKIVPALDKVLSTQTNSEIMATTHAQYPTNVDIVVLSEYTLDGEPSDALKDWCRTNQKFLVIGGKSPAPGSNYYNTAFVISTNGEIVFQQVKSVPIQFFTDGLPAPEQKIWESPWGKIGICICYDLSYTRVTDELVRQGAQMLIVPSMDEMHWGKHQHELHARVAPVRASEYGVPIFRVASSGISQGVSRVGRVLSTAPFPGEEEVIVFGARLPRNGGTLPIDRWLAPFCVGVTGIFVAWLAFEFATKKHKPHKTKALVVIILLCLLCLFVAIHDRILI